MALALVTLGCEQPTSSTPKAKAVDKTALAAALADAETLITETIVSDDAATVSSGGHYVTTSEKDTFREAIDAARTIHDKPGVTQAEIDTAKSQLDAAKAAFVSARDSHTGTSLQQLDSAALAAKITAANTLVGTTTVGETEADVPQNVHFVTGAEKTAFLAAIQAAQAELDRAQSNTTTQTAIDAAVAALESAITEFTNAKASHTGTSQSWSFIVSFYLNYADAGDNPESITISAPNTSLAAADRTLPQPQPRAGYSFAGWFDNQEGTGGAFTVNTDLSRDTPLYAKWLPDLDTAALAAKIAEAEALIDDDEIAVSDDSDAVPEGQHYVTTAEKAAFQAAIDAARTTLTTAGTPGAVTQTAVNAAVTTLESAITAFNTAKAKVGTEQHWSYTISFNLNYEGADTNPGPVVISDPHRNWFESQADAPLPQPQRTDWIFDGWYHNEAGTGAAFTINTAVSGNTQLYARWIQYHIILHLNGGAVAGETVVNDTITISHVGTADISLPAAATKSGYVFGGWYADSGYTGAAVTVVAAGAAGDQNFWAKWKPYEYDLKFNGSLANDADSGLPAAVYVQKMQTNAYSQINGTQTYNPGVTAGTQALNVKGATTGADLTDAAFVKLDNNEAGDGKHIATATSFDYNQSFTIALWVKLNSAGYTDPILFSNKHIVTGASGNAWTTVSSDNNADGFAIYAQDDGSGKRSIRLNSKSVSDSAALGSGSENLTIAQDVTGSWVHIAAVYDKSVGTGQVRYYANGAKIGESNTDLSSGMTGNFIMDNTPFVAASYIGNSASNKRLYFRSSKAYAINFDVQNFILKGGAMTDAQVMGLVDATFPAALATPVLAATPSDTASGTFTYSWTPETADPVTVYRVYVKPGTSAETNPAAIATADALVSTTSAPVIAASPATYTGAAGGKFNIVVSATRGSQTVYSNTQFVTTGDYTPVAPVLTFATGTANDGEISYSWTAGQYVTGHKLYVAIGSYTTAADVIANGFVTRTATPAEVAAGVPTTTVKGNPGLTYSAVVESLNGITPVYSNVVSNVQAKGALSAATNIARLYASLDVTSQWDTTTNAGDKAVNGSITDRWSTASSALNTGNTDKKADLTLTFGLPVQVNAAGIIDYGTTRAFRIQYLAADGITWQDAYVRDGAIGGATTANENLLNAMDFPMVQATKIRLRLEKTSAPNGTTSIWEFRLFRENYGVNIAPLAAVSASSVHSADYAAAKAVDNDAYSRWAVLDADWTATPTAAECWLEFDYGSETKTVNAAAMRSFGARIGSFKIQYWSGGAWQDAHVYPGPGAVNGATTGGSPKVKWDFSTVSATKFRLLITSSTALPANAPSIWEFYLYSPN